MKKRLYTFIIAITGIITFGSCTSDSPDGGDENNSTPTSTSTVSYTIPADQLEFEWSDFPKNTVDWLVNCIDNSNWYTFDVSNGLSQESMRMSLAPNTSGKERSLTFTIRCYDKKDRLTDIMITLTQRPLTADGKSMEMTLTNRVLSGITNYFYTPAFDLTATPLEIRINGNIVDTHIIDAHNATYQISGGLKGKYSMTVSFGDTLYDFGYIGLYSYEGPLFTTTLPVLLHADNAAGLVTFGVSSDINTNRMQATVAYTDNGECDDTWYFEGADGRVFKTPMFDMTRINADLFSCMINYVDENDPETCIRYNDIDYTATRSNSTRAHNFVIIDRTTGVCYNVDVTDRYFEQFMWGADNYRQSNNTLLYGAVRPQETFSIEVERMTAKQAMAAAQKNENKTVFVHAELLKNADNIMRASGTRLLLSAEDGYWENGDRIASAVFPRADELNLDGESGHAFIKGIPVYKSSSFLRVINYTRKQLGQDDAPTGINLHEIIVDDQVSGKKYATMTWDSTSDYALSFETFAYPDHTYLLITDPVNEIVGYDVQPDRTVTVTAATKPDSFVSGDILGMTYPYYNSRRYIRLDDNSYASAPVMSTDPADYVKLDNMPEFWWICALGTNSAAFSTLVGNTPAVVRYRGDASTPQTIDFKPDFSGVTADYMIEF